MRNGDELLVFADKVFLEPILYVYWRSTDTRLPQVRLLAHLEEQKGPWPLRGSRRDGHGVAWLHATPAAFISYVLVQFSVRGAAGHNRWGVASPPLPPKTQSRNMNRSSSTGALCGRVSFYGCSPRRGGPSSGVRWVLVKTDRTLLHRGGELEGCRVGANPTLPLRHQPQTRLGETRVKWASVKTNRARRRPEERWAPSPELDGRGLAFRCLTPHIF